MGKKNKYKPKPEGAGGDGGGAGPSGTQQQQPAPAQVAPPQQPQPPQQQPAGADGGRAVQQSRQRQQQQQQRPQQQQQQAAGGSGWPQQQQQRPQQQQQQQRPQQQQQQQRPQQQQQQQRPQQQQQQQQQHQQQRPQQQQGAGGGGRQQQQPPPQQQQQRPQQQHQQQRPQQQQGAGGGGRQQQQPPPQQQQQRPQQQQQQQRPQQQQGAVGGGRQQQQQQRPQQQQQRPQQQQQQGAGGSGPRQQQPPPVRQMQGQASVSHASSSASLASSTSVSSIKRGTAGIHGQVEVNYLQMDLSKMPDVAYHYDVTIDPDRPKKYIRGAFSKFVNEFLGGIACAFDGQKSCYTVQRLEHDLYDGEVELDDTGGRSIKFKVTVKATDTIEVDLSSLKTYQQERIYDKPMRALQCLEVALANACHNRGVRTGRSFYVKPQQKIDLKDGYELWTGLFQAAILGDQPFVNVDISHKSFPSECSLIDWLRLNTDINRPLDHRAISSLRTFLKGLQIMYRPPESFGAVPKTYTVQDVLQEPANRLSFTLEDGRKMTVCEYFQSRNYTLRYPHLNCLHLGSRVRTNYMPIELCYIPSGQTINKKDGPRQVQEMIRYAATSTDERKRKIMHLLNYFAHNTDPLIGRFGIRLGSQFIQVPMRLLRAPGIEYCGGELLRVQNGSWRLNLSTKFLATSKPQPSHKWAIIYSKRGRTSIHVVQKFASMLSDAAKKLGMFLADRPEIRDFDNIDKVLSEMKTQNFNLVIVILPAFGTSYAETKQKAELRCGILTQCIKEQTVDRRLDHQLVLNLLLKINAKLNGTNHKIANDPQVLLKNVMYIGADVTHPSPDQRHLPSVVGVAASHDAHGACYNMQYRLQRSTLEEIEDMGNIFAHHLKVYHAHQKQYPNHVIYYRDGVSDGQFPKIRDQELAAMRAACKRLQLSPKFTCIIVVKRHHTRFFPQTEADRFNKFNNVVPGTVVDRVIVHPNEVQFFMVSHQSIQGTAKPTRYNVIVDDAHLDIDLVQKLTNNLCHMFPRCNRAVSYPAPAYLAHLAAFRGRVYLEGQNTFRDLREEYNRRLINPGFLTSNPMYFV